MTTPHVVKPRWHYSGDVNLEYGGLFYRIATFDDGYVDYIQVTPCSDAGGPDNCYWINQGNIIIHGGFEYAFWGVGDTAAERLAHRTLHDMPDAERTESALKCCGWDDRLAEWDKLTQVQRKHAIVDACMGYGHYDQDRSEMVSIGQPEFTKNREGKWEPDKVLRANANLRRYVLKG